MYRPKRTRTMGDELTLDSLMDVLTCSVGVMLFVVIFAVIEAKGSSVIVFSPPFLREPPGNSQRVLALCIDGKVRILDARAAVERLTEDLVQLTYDDVPEFVSSANRKGVSDGHFSYRLVYRDEQASEFRRKRVISVQVDELPGVAGDSPDELASGDSAFERALDGLEKNRHWLAFGVDADSVEAFRAARAVAMERGFATGWDPVAVEFPYEEVIIGGGRKKQVEGMPRSGLGIIQ